MRLCVFCHCSSTYRKRKTTYTINPEGRVCETYPLLMPSVAHACFWGGLLLQEIDSARGVLANDFATKRGQLLAVERRQIKDLVHSSLVSLAGTCCDKGDFVPPVLA